MTNQNNTVLYIGVTNDIIRRIAEHKAKINKGFTYKYNCDKLVFYERFYSIEDAIAREKQLKNWKREWKNELVIGVNSEWKDLSEQIGVNEELIEGIKVHYEKFNDK
jgi:putative endonuclease